VRISRESVIDVFSFIPPLYYQDTTPGISGTGRTEEGWQEKVGATYPLICPRIARASAAGSAASVIGLPTTIWLAPEAMASAGVTTRA
jgi:hypothetical protein